MLQQLANTSVPLRGCICRSIAVQQPQSFVTFQPFCSLSKSCSVNHDFLRNSTKWLKNLGHTELLHNNASTNVTAQRYTTCISSSVFVP